MKQTKKRLLSLVLAAMMAVSLLPLTALAAEPENMMPVEITPTESLSVTSAEPAATALGEATEATEIEPSEGPRVSTQSGSEFTVALTGVYYYQQAYSLFNQINQERSANGAAKLKMDSKLWDAAMQRAQECAVYFANTRPNGDDCLMAVVESGADGSIGGENIAGGYSSATDVMDAWMNSSGNRSNILNTNFTAVGVGCYMQVNGAPCWVLLLTDGSGDSPSAPENVLATGYVRATESYLGGMSLELEKTKLNSGKTTTATASLVNQGWNQINWFPKTESLTFSSSKSSVASVSSDGEVTAKKGGSATIRAKLDGSSLSASRKLTVGSSISKKKPTGVKVSNQKTGIKVSWNKLSGADKYAVYRSTAGGSYKKVKTTTKTSWTDTNKKNGTKYKYKVYAYDGSTRSKASSFKTMIRLTRPTITKLSQSDGIAQVRWKTNSKATGCKAYIYDSSGVFDSAIAEGSKNQAYLLLNLGEKSTVRLTFYKKYRGKVYESAKSDAKSIYVPLS